MENFEATTVCVKYRILSNFLVCKFLWKGTVSVEFWEIRPKLCGNCVFPQNFHTRNFGEISVFYAVSDYSVHLVPTHIAAIQNVDKHQSIWTENKTCPVNHVLNLNVVLFQVVWFSIRVSSCFKVKIPYSNLKKLSWVPIKK